MAMGNRDHQHHAARALPPITHVKFPSLYCLFISDWGVCKSCVAFIGATTSNSTCIRAGFHSTCWHCTDADITATMGATHVAVDGLLRVNALFCKD